jgi:hypothetical protein
VTINAWLYVLLAALAVWIIGGFVWLFPRKLVLMRRYPGASYYDFVRFARGGDIEAQHLLRDSKRYLVLGVVLAIALTIVRAAIPR